MIIEAKQITVSEEEGILTIAFADDPGVPARWLILQRTIRPTAQDVRLGQNTVHISTSSNGAGVYGGVSLVSVMPGRLVIAISPEARLQLKCGPEVILTFAQATVDYANLVDALRRVIEPTARS